MIQQRFPNRSAAGHRLAPLLLLEYRNKPDMLLLLALPRVGVPIACQIAKLLHLPVDARILGAPTYLINLLWAK